MRIRVRNKQLKYITFFMPNVDSGGAEKVIIDIANSLYKKGYKIEFFYQKKQVI